MAGARHKQRRSRLSLPGAARVHARRADVPPVAPSTAAVDGLLSSPSPTHTVSCALPPQVDTNTRGDSMQGTVTDGTAGLMAVNLAAAERTLVAQRKDDAPSSSERLEPPIHAPVSHLAPDPGERDILSRTATVFDVPVCVVPGSAPSQTSDGDLPTVAQAPHAELASSATLPDHHTVAMTSPPQSPLSQHTEKIPAVAQGVHATRTCVLPNQRRHARRRQPPRPNTPDKTAARCSDGHGAQPAQTVIAHATLSAGSAALCGGAALPAGEGVAVAPSAMAPSAVTERGMMSKTSQWQQRHKVQGGKRRFFTELQDVGPNELCDDVERAALQSAPVPPPLALTAKVAATSAMRDVGTADIIAVARRRDRGAKRHRRVPINPSSVSPPPPPTFAVTCTGTGVAPREDGGGDDGATPQALKQSSGEARTAAMAPPTPQPSTSAEAPSAESDACMVATLPSGGTARSRKTRRTRRVLRSAKVCAARAAAIAAATVATVASAATGDKAGTSLQTGPSLAAVPVVQANLSAKKESGAEEQTECQRKTSMEAAATPSPVVSLREARAAHRHVTASSTGQTLPGAPPTPVVSQSESDKCLGTDLQSDKPAVGPPPIVSLTISNAAGPANVTAEPVRRATAAKAARWLRRKSRGEVPRQMATLSSTAAHCVSSAMERPVKAVGPVEIASLQSHYRAAASPDEPSVTPTTTSHAVPEPQSAAAFGARRVVSTTIKARRRRANPDSAVTQVGAADDGATASVAPTTVANPPKRPTRPEVMGAGGEKSSGEVQLPGLHRASDGTTTLEAIPSTECRDSNAQRFDNKTQQPPAGVAMRTTTDIVSSHTDVSREKAWQEAQPDQAFVSTTSLRQEGQSGGKLTAPADADLQTVSQAASRARRQANMARKLRRFRARWHAATVAGEATGDGCKAFSPVLSVSTQGRLDATTHAVPAAAAALVSNRVACVSQEVNTTDTDLIRSQDAPREKSRILQHQSVLDAPVAGETLSAIVGSGSSGTEHDYGRGGDEAGEAGKVKSDASIAETHAAQTSSECTEKTPRDWTHTSMPRSAVHSDLPLTTAPDSTHAATPNPQTASAQLKVDQMRNTNLHASVGAATTATATTLPAQLRRLSARQRIKQHAQKVEARHSRPPRRATIVKSEGVQTMADRTMALTTKDKSPNEVNEEDRKKATAVAPTTATVSARLPEAVQDGANRGAGKAVTSTVVEQSSSPLTAKPALAAPSLESMRPLAIPGNRLSIELFTPEEMILRRASLDDAWQLGLRFDWNERLLALRSLPGMTTDNACLQHPFFRLFRSRPAWYLQTVNGANATHLTDVMNALKCALQAHITFRKP